MLKEILASRIAQAETVPDQRLQDASAVPYAPRRETASTSELVARLVAAFEEQAVVYCHWKSNLSLTLALSGETDLDLLVDCGSLQRALAILTSLGYKRGVVRWGPSTQGVSHYYGLDPQLGQLSHVHLFSQVLTGESLVKSHLLPFGPMLLENTDRIGEIIVTSKPAELVVFVLRVFINYGSLLDLIYLLGRAEDIRTELRWLQDTTDPSEVLSLLREHCSVIDEQLFSRCIETLHADTSLTQRVILARQIRRRLRTYSRYNVVSRVSAYARLLWGEVRRRLSGSRRNRILSARGAVIAFVGPDASGKSTLVSACKHWLGGALAVRTVHAGRPPSSLLTAPINIALWLARRWSWMRSLHSRGQDSAFDPTQSQLKVPDQSSLAYAIRALSLAWDRRRVLVAARRSADNGVVVICDRYPSEVAGAVDSRRLQEHQTRGGPMLAVLNWLARAEEGLYKQIPAPDVVLRLRLTSEMARERNRGRIKAGKEGEADMERRYLQSRDWDVSGARYVYEVDVERPPSETILNVKKLIWESL
jgi:thymidylate kinase